MPSQDGAETHTVFGLAKSCGRRPSDSAARVGGPGRLAGSRAQAGGPQSPVSAAPATDGDPAECCRDRAGTAEPSIWTEITAKACAERDRRPASGTSRRPSPARAETTRRRRPGPRRGDEVAKVAPTQRRLRPPAPRRDATRRALPSRSPTAPDGCAGRTTSRTRRRASRGGRRPRRAGDRQPVERPAHGETPTPQGAARGKRRVSGAVGSVPSKQGPLAARVPTGPARTAGLQSARDGRRRPSLAASASGRARQPRGGRSRTPTRALRRAAPTLATGRRPIEKTK